MLWDRNVCVNPAFPPGRVSERNMLCCNDLRLSFRAALKLYPEG